VPAMLAAALYFLTDLSMDSVLFATCPFRWFLAVMALGSVDAYFPFRNLTNWRLLFEHNICLVVVPPVAE
jgi:hypothetical protein